MSDSKTPLYFVIGVILVIFFGVGIYVSDEPDMFDVREAAAQKGAESGLNADAVGFTTTNTLVEVTDVLLNKPGGYMSNDILPPFVILDNMPSWEFGVVVQIRDLSRALRKDLARSQSQSTEDANLAIAEPQFHFDHKSFMFPDTEGEYKRGIKEVNKYLYKLADPQQPNAQFYARADNLRNWLQDVETRLGSLSQRLSASIGRRSVDVDLAGDANAQQSTPRGGDIAVRTPRWQVDNVFYEARGTAWALLHFLKAIEVDFQSVLENKNATVSLRQIIRELEATQEPVLSPIILNGDGMGVLANHSLVMANYISRANAAIIELRGLLLQG